MAILVSNPSTVQFTGAPTEPQDPAVNPLVAGFTEELAIAMQPPGQQADGTNLAQKPLVPLVESKLNDLQILPPDVLINAVGEANFAFVAQGAQASQESALIKEVGPEVSDTSLLDALDPTKAAEMAAAELAAQMAAQTAVQTAAQSAPVDTTVSQSEASIATEALDSADAATAGVAVGIGYGEASSPNDVVVVNSPTNLMTTNVDLKLESGAPIDLATAQISSAAQNLQQVAQGPQVLVSQQPDAKPVLVQAEALVAAVQTNSEVKTASAGEVIAITDSSQQSQAAESLTTKVNQINPTTVESIVKASHSQSVETIATAPTIDSAAQPSTALNLQKSAFDIAKSDVAKPIYEDSANLKQPSNFLQTADAALPSGGSLEGVSNSGTTVANTTLLVESNAVENESPVGDSANQLIQTAKSEVTAESSFKFDAKLGAQSPEVAFAGKAKTSVPVSLGGAAGPDVPVSLAASAPLKGTVVESQVIDSSDAVVVTQAQTLKDGKVVVLESSVQTTSITTNALQTGGTPVVHKTATSSTQIQVLNTTESMAENRQNKTELSEVLSDEFLSEAADELGINQTSSTAALSNAGTSRFSQNTRDSSSLFEVDPANALASVGVNAQQVMTESAKVSVSQSDAVQPSAMGFSDVSSTFVNTLVGGPQRPITTVMDWVTLKPQEPPRPVMPHELRLDAGAVQVEIQRMVKQGGGHVVMELTPPDQSKFTIELKLDDMGGAYLKVEGVSDSTKTRLEQSAPQLQEQFQQMGLNLQLDMRQNRDSSSSGAADWTPNESGFDNNQPQESTPQATRAAAAERARKNNGGQVFLYA